jgi:hypothetical protein
MEKKMKEVKAAVSLIIKEDFSAIKQIFNNFTKKTSKDPFMSQKGTEEGNKTEENKSDEII